MATRVYINNNKVADKGMPWAVEYYARYQDHVVTSNLHLRRDTVHGSGPHITAVRHFNLLNLLDTIVQTTSKSGDNIMIVCHGMPTELGIFQKPGTNVWINIPYVDGLANDFAGTMDRLAMSETDWDAMAKHLYTIRQRSIKHIAIQACRIGRSKAFLRQFANVLGASSISAPTLKTIYGNCEVYLADDKQKQKFRQDYPNFFNVPVTGGGVVTLAAKTLEDHSMDLIMITDSVGTLFRFLVDNFPALPNLGDLNKSTLRSYGEILAGVTKPSLLPFHGLIVSKSPLKIYFPKDPRYAAHMTYLSVR